MAAAAVARCPRCEVEVPEHNLALHEARCGGRGTAPPAAGEGAAVGRSGAGEALPPPTAAQLAQALTWARTRPSEVLEALLVRRQHYKGKEYFPPEREGRCVVTKEGAAAVEDAIAYVKALQPMGGVGEASEIGLQLAAEDHVADIGRSGTAAHDSSDGTTSGERAKRYGEFSCFGECLWYGSWCADARTAVLDLIVDDGVATRGHRKGIYNPVYDIVGCAYGPHSTFGNMIAMEFASGWQGNEMFIRARKQSGPVKMSEEVMAKAKAKASTQWSLGSCPVCNEPIKGGKVVEVAQLGGKLHAECFKCNACSEQLTGKAFRMQAKLAYCTPCHVQHFGEKCAACGEAIGGATVKCSIGLFHPECMVCASCGKNVAKGGLAPSSTAGAIACQSCAGSGSGTGSRLPSRAGKHASPLATAGAGIAAARPQAPGRPSSSGAVRRGSSPAPAPKARAPGASRREGSPGPKAKPKPKPKASMGAAKVSLMGLAGDYDGLA